LVKTPSEGPNTPPPGPRILDPHTHTPFSKIYTGSHDLSHQPKKNSSPLLKSYQVECPEPKPAPLDNAAKSFPAARCKNLNQTPRVF